MDSDVNINEQSLDSRELFETNDSDNSDIDGLSSDSDNRKGIIIDNDEEENHSKFEDVFNSLKKNEESDEESTYGDDKYSININLLRSNDKSDDKNLVTNTTNNTNNKVTLEFDIPQNMMYDREGLLSFDIKKLKDICKNLKLVNYFYIPKDEMINIIMLRLLGYLSPENKKLIKFLSRNELEKILRKCGVHCTTKTKIEELVKKAESYFVQQDEKEV